MIKYLPNEIKQELFEQLKENYRVNIKNFENKFFYTNKKEKVYLSDFDLLKLIETNNLEAVNLGIYIGKFHKNRFRLNIEGANLFKPEKNILILKEESLNSFLYGEDLEKNDFENFDENYNNPKFTNNKFNTNNINNKEERLLKKDDINNNQDNETKRNEINYQDINLNIFLPVKYKKYFLGSVLYNERFFKNFISKGRKVEFNKIF